MKSPAIFLSFSRPPPPYLFTPSIPDKWVGETVKIRVIL